jgi:hypothetical protein
MTDVLAPRMVTLEQVISYAPLGIRFWDAVAGRVVGEGLTVRARRAGTTAPVAIARTSQSGINGFVRLPGLEFLEHPGESVATAASPPAVQLYVVDVIDALDRFVPVAFRVHAPHAGIFPDGTGSPPDSGPPGFFLFPSATRSASGTIGVLRAELHDRVRDTAAAHAVVELSLPGNRVDYGLADEAGRVVVMFAYPRFAPTVLSPPSTADAARERPSWPATVRVLYDPAAQVSLGPGLPPDLASLFGQPAAQLRPASGQPPVTQFDLTVVMGQDAVLRTDNEPRLLIR